MSFLQSGRKGLTNLGFLTWPCRPTGIRLEGVMLIVLYPYWCVCFVAMECWNWPKDFATAFNLWTAISWWTHVVWRIRQLSKCQNEGKVDTQRDATLSRPGKKILPYMLWLVLSPPSGWTLMELNAWMECLYVAVLKMNSLLSGKLLTSSWW